jgi:hypothetical protein
VEKKEKSIGRKGWRLILIVAVLMAVAVSVTCCVAEDDEDIQQVGGGEPRGDKFKLSNGSLLSRIYDGKVGAEPYVMGVEYDGSGKVVGMEVGDTEYEVEYEPFRLSVVGLSNRVDRWKTFKFTQGGNISSCVHEQSDVSGDRRTTTYSMAYDNNRLLSIHANGDGWCTGDKGVSTWVRSMDVNITWRNSTMAIVSLNDRERADGEDLTDVVYTYDYGYGTTDNQFRQMPILLCDAMGELEMFAVLGLLGEGPSRLPNSGNVVRNRNLVGGRDWGYSVGSILIDIEKTSNGEIGRENDYRYVYQRGE